MTQKDKDWWEQTRSKGRSLFSLREGILRYGMQVAFALAVLQATGIIFFTRESVPLITLAMECIVDAVIFASLIGIVLWKQHEKDYHKDDHVG